MNHPTPSVTEDKAMEDKKQTRTIELTREEAHLAHEMVTGAIDQVEATPLTAAQRAEFEPVIAAFKTLQAKFAPA